MNIVFYLYIHQKHEPQFNITSISIPDLVSWLDVSGFKKTKPLSLFLFFLLFLLLYLYIVIIIITIIIFRLLNNINIYIYFKLFFSSSFFLNCFRFPHCLGIIC
jgi:hypothetical protein